MKGSYEFVNPTVLIRDIDLVKKITIKDFDNFIDHRSFADNKVEPLFARNLFALKGEEWKDMRSTLSPAFTSSKIKLMVPFMEDAGDQMIRALKKKIGESKNTSVPLRHDWLPHYTLRLIILFRAGHIDVDCKDLTSRYANDVIASCAFGLKMDSHTEEENQFYEMGKLASEFKLRKMLFFLVLSACPVLVKYLKISLFTSRTKDFFIELVTSTMKNRETNKIIRPDMIHLLMEAKKVWSDIDLTAQAVLFFIAGFETISIAMSFALHELAVHPEVQDRLVKEIKEQHVKNGGKLNFNAIQSMTYMDMVTSEVLRRWPPILALDRQCLKDYNMGKPNTEAAENFIMKQGEILSIPVWCFHHDPEYFLDPYKFDPERFSEENKHKINSMTYMSFGIGSRNCIGSRFALCELKSLLYQVLLHMEVSPSSALASPCSSAPSHSTHAWLVDTG